MKEPAVDLTGELGVHDMTRFLAEQLSTAHWFAQRRTREVLGWEPTAIETSLRDMAESIQL